MPETIKILYLVTQSEFGGAQRYIFDLVTNLPDSKYHAEVAAGGSGELFSSLEKAGVKSYRLKNLVRQINPIKDVAAYLEIKKLLQKTRPDILHLNSSKAGVIGAIAGSHAGIKKIIYTVHGFVFNEPLPNWKKNIYLVMEKFSAKYKDKLICVSEFDRKIGIKKRICAPEKLITIRNGIEQIEFLDQQWARNELKLDQNMTIVGTVANFYPTKGLPDLVQAAKTVNQKIPGTVFAVIGDGGKRNLLETKINELKLNKNFILLGEKKEAWRYLKAFDAYVCSSVKEGLPYSIMEAMAAGLPVIATKVGGIPELIEENVNGLLVEPRNPDKLAEKIITVLKGKDLADRLSAQSKDKVEKYFNLARVIKDTENIYRS